MKSEIIIQNPFKSSKSIYFISKINNVKEKNFHSIINKILINQTSLNIVKELLNNILTELYEIYNIICKVKTKEIMIK